MGTPMTVYAWSGYFFESRVVFGLDPMKAYMYIDYDTIGEDEYTSYYVRGGCTWQVKNVREPTIAGPEIPWGHYEVDTSSSQEGTCLPGEMYDDVGIYPSGLPSHEYAIQDWESGEILVILHWDGTTYNGYDIWGQHIVAMPAEDGSQFAGIFGHVDRCTFSVMYSFTSDTPVLPPIDDIMDGEEDWHFNDAYGIWNGDLNGGTCVAPDPDVEKKYDTLLCIWPNGPAVLNLVQCNDKREDYQTILQQAWWRGGSQQWVGVDYGYKYTWGYKQDDDGEYDDITFVIAGEGNDGCSFELILWRGDDCETNGWKIGISILSVLTTVLLLVVVFLFTQGGGSGGGYQQYQ
jgi:hypothetical protein